MPLQPLTEADVGRYVSLRFPGELAPGLVRAIHGHTDGNPMFITENGDPQNVDANSSGYVESRPNLVPGQSVHVANQGPNLWFNTAAFSNTGMSFGNSPRNPVVAPGLHTLDASLSKSFRMPYKESQRLLFRLEAFNSTNTPQWSKPGATLGTSTFGIVTSAGANRVMQAALKYSF